MIESLLSEIASKGWLVNNAFQISEDEWRVNLRRFLEKDDSGIWVTDFGLGRTLEDALAEAISRIDEAEFVEREEEETHIAKIGDLEAPSGSSLLEKLGLKKPFVRRV